jgi:hypothetical protein
LNKLFSPTTITCETIININEQRIENSICNSTTAGLLTVNRQINFDSQIENQTFIFKDQNLTSIRSKTKDDFDIFLKQICTNNELNSYNHLTNLMNYDLDDEELNKILFQNTTQYSNCEWLKLHSNLLYFIFSFNSTGK